MNGADKADDAKVVHGTPAWFEMVGALMIDAALRARPGPPADVSLVERYTDGPELDGGLAQGLRFAIAAGKPSFRHGVRRDERGDITIDVTTAASRTLNTLYGADPRFAAALAGLQARGDFRIEGDLARLGEWFARVHDRIVARTS